MKYADINAAGIFEIAYSHELNFFRIVPKSLRNPENLIEWNMRHLPGATN